MKQEAQNKKIFTNVKRSILNKDDRISHVQLKEIDPLKYEKSLAVASIRFTMNTVGRYGRATAWKISDKGLMLTNYHTIMKAREIKETVVTFSYLKSIKEDNSYYEREEKIYINVERVIDSDLYLDYALFELAPYESATLDEFGYLEIDPDGAKLGQKIYIPQCPSPEEKIIAYCETVDGIEMTPVIEVLQNQMVYYNADTMPGASGSPVISVDTNKVVALHKDGSTTINGGVNIKYIWEKIQKFI